MLLEKQKRAVRRLPTDREDVFAYEVNGHVSTGELDDISLELDKAYRRFDRINLLVRLHAWNGVDWTSAFSETSFIGRMRALSHVDRYAVVGGPSWIALAITFCPQLFNMEVRHFDEADADEAWAWVNEDIGRRRAA
ncbi:STAS/SEC14 domain-containing protein [Hoeflea sp. WL0058]|uniref:STAS/SEC14 domain-containing protein n=1 Tax=Flavimaribacter sediminis TaxID=2865987 RepID=A0AAE3CZH8_9HYPH|nr:STAS/SEC14 domain-containing protein [Flavimaribacter sediminis]MBW8635843.1 STAS/SEC14 domain-containing protein [Flavimaribacter sediminis]